MVAIFCQSRVVPARDKASEVKVNRLYSVEKPSHLKTNDTGSVFYENNPTGIISSRFSFIRC